MKNFKKIYLNIPFIIVCIISILLFCQACLLNNGEVELEDKIRELENEKAILKKTIQEQESIIGRLVEEKKSYEKRVEQEINLYKGTDNDARIRIINRFSNNWVEFQRNISQHPILGATAWDHPREYQFIGNNRMFIAFGDGHIALASVIQYNCDKGSTGGFTLLDTFDYPYYPFNETRWNELFNKYGDKNLPIHSYTRSIFRGGQSIQYDNWTEVPENIFIWHPEGY